MERYPSPPTGGRLASFQKEDGLRWILIGLLALSLAGCDEKKKSKKAGKTAETSFTCTDLFDRELAIYKGDPTTPEQLVERLADKEFVAKQRSFVVTQCERLSKAGLAVLKACQDRASTFIDSQQCSKLKLLPQPSEDTPKVVSADCAPACIQLVDHALRWPDEVKKKFAQKHGGNAEIQAMHYCLSQCIDKGLPEKWRQCLKTNAFDPFMACVQPK